MADTDEKGVKSTISHNRIGNHATIKIGYFSNSSLNLSAEGNLQVKKDNTEFLNSLGSINPDQDKVILEAFNKELPSDGFDWVQDLEQYRNWKTGKDEPVLWIQDETGVGHTPLTLELLGRLGLSIHGNLAPMVAYSFCQPSSRIGRTITHALQGLSTSILQKDTDILTQMRRKHHIEFQQSTESHRSQHSINENLLEDILSELARISREVYLIIDGVSSLADNSPGCDANRVLKSFVSKFRTFRWIITSRSPPPPSWTSANSGRLVSKLVLTATNVAQGLGLDHAIQFLTSYGIGLKKIYQDLIPPGGSSEHLSWFKYTIRGRGWLDPPSNMKLDAIWYRSCGGKTIPYDLSLNVLQTVREWDTNASYKSYGAYFSFSFLQSPQKSSQRPGSTTPLNPAPALALWCLFAQLICDKHPDHERMAKFLSSIPKLQQRSLRAICDLSKILTTSQWLEPDGSIKNTTGANNLASRPTDIFEGWLPFQEWDDFLDESYCPILCELLSSLISKPDGSRHTLVVDSIHIPPLKSWMNCLNNLLTIKTGPINSARLFISGTCDLEKEDEPRLGVSLPDVIDDHTEYQECLDQLYFDSIHHRREQVPDAFQNTNQWIWNHLAYGEWKNTGGLLWISGKAGSGKSVMAKTIFRDFLDQSSNNKAKGKGVWLVCDWFYSRRDHDVGIAHSSMLKALLYEILSYSEESFEIGRKYYRNAWDSLHKNQEGAAWPVGVLKEMLQALSENPSTPETLVIVDGLDESEDDKEREHILQLLVKIGSVAHGRIRILVLSRPEPIFEESFGQCRRIVMQENNAEDISSIVDTGLNVMRHLWIKVTSPEYETSGRNKTAGDFDGSQCHISNWEHFSLQSAKALPKHQGQELERIRQYLLQHSDGVTLWARLVLEHLVLRISGADMGFTLQDLRKILEAIPTKLYDLYNHILGTLALSPDSRKRATAMFKWIVGSITWGHLQLQDFLDATAIPEDSDASDNGDDDPILLNQLQVGDNWDLLRKIIFKHCGSLVEFVESDIRTPDDGVGEPGRRVGKAGPTWTLQLIHQTVRKFLETSKHHEIHIEPQEAQRAVLDASYKYLRIVLPKHKVHYLQSQQLGQSNALAIIPREEIIEPRNRNPLGSLASVISGGSGNRQPLHNSGPRTLKPNETSRELLIPWLEYFSKRPFTRYALRILLEDRSNRPGDWIRDSIFRSEEADIVINEAFPLWWSVVSYIPDQTLGQKDYLRHFARYACERGGLVPLEILFGFMKLLQATYYQPGGPNSHQQTTRQRTWSLLQGAIDQLLATAAMNPACYYPIANVLLEMYSDREEMDKISMTAVTGEDAPDNPTTTALSAITSRRPGGHPEVSEPTMSQDLLYERHCKNITVPISSSDNLGHVIDVPVWKMHQAANLILDFIKESRQYSNTLPDLSPIPGDLISMNHWLYKLWDKAKAENRSSTSRTNLGEDEHVSSTRPPVGITEEEEASRHQMQEELNNLERQFYQPHGS